MAYLARFISAKREFSHAVLYVAILAGEKGNEPTGGYIGYYFYFFWSGLLNLSFFVMLCGLEMTPHGLPEDREIRELTPSLSSATSLYDLNLERKSIFLTAVIIPTSPCTQRKEWKERLPDRPGDTFSSNWMGDAFPSHG